AQMIGQCDRRGKEGFKRGFLDVLRSRALKPGIEVIVEVRSKIDLIEWICRTCSVGGSGSLGGGSPCRRSLGEGFRSLACLYFLRIGGALCDLKDVLVGRIRYPLGFE